MTSPKFSANKQSASYDFKRALLSLLMPAVVLTLSLLVVIGLRVSGELSFLSDKLIPSPTVKLVSEWDSLWVPVWCLFGGVLFAVTNFYIMSKSTVNFFLSAPVDRRTLFKNRTLAALLLGAVAIGLNVLISLVMNLVVIKVFPGFIIKMALAVFAECYVYFLAAYVIMTIGIFTCYTIVEGFFFGGGLLLLPTVVIWFLNSAFTVFLNGYAGRQSSYMFDSYYGSTFLKPGLGISLSILNPLFFGRAFGAEDVDDNIIALANAGYTNGVTDYVDGAIHAAYDPAVLPDKNYLLPVLIWAVLCVLGLLFARYLFIHRKAEKTAINGSSPFATHLFAAEAALAAGWIGCLVLDSRKENGTKTYTAMIGLTIGILLVNLIVLAVAKRQVIFKNKKAYLVPLGVACTVLVLTAALHGGGLGYSAYAPAAEDVALALVTGGGYGEPLHNEAIGAMSYDILPGPRYDAMDGVYVLADKKADIEKITALQKQLAQHPSDRETSTVCVVYLTKSGKKTVRWYSVKSKKVEDALLSLTDTEAFKETYSDLLLGTDNSRLAEKSKQLGYTMYQLYGYLSGDIGDLEDFKQLFAESEATFMPFYADTVNDISGVPVENTKALREALVQDMNEATYLDRYRAQETELGVLSFSAPPEQVDDSGEYIGDIMDAPFGTYEYRVYPSMKNTVAYLTKAGVITGKETLFPVQPESAYVVKISDFTENRGWTVTGMENAILFSAFTAGVDALDNEVAYFKGDELMSPLKNLKDYFGNNEITDKAQLQQLMGASRAYALAKDDDYMVCYRYRDSFGTEWYQFMLIYGSEYPIG